MGLNSRGSAATLQSKKSPPCDPLPCIRGRDVVVVEKDRGMAQKGMPDLLLICMAKGF